MKKLLIGLLAVALVAVFAGTAMADGWQPACYGPDGGPLDGHEPDCGYLGAYVKVSKPFDYSCNGQYMVPGCGFQSAVKVPFKISASVAQWVQIHVSATKIEWRVLKPGDYQFCSAILIDLKSNGDLVIFPHGFENLKYVCGAEPDEIETYYRMIMTGTSWGEWKPAADFNTVRFFIGEDQEHNKLQARFDARIVVGECDSACEYKDPCGAWLEVRLNEQKEWMGRFLPCNDC